MRFSKLTQSFYPEDIEYSNPPADLVTCTDAEHQLAMNKQSGETLDFVAGSLVIVPAPAKTPSQVQSERITYLYESYGAAIQLPVSYMATTFQADDASQIVLTKCLVAGSVPAGFFWLDATNVRVPMTFTQLKGLASAMLVQGQIAFDNLQTKKTAVLAASTIAEILAIVW